MKRTWIVAAAVCAAVLLAACGKSAKNTESTANTVTESTARESGNQESSASASKEAPGNTEEFKILTGKVTKIADTMDSMTIVNEGKETTFDLSNVVVETSYALEPDVEVSVIYKGEISGGDTTNARIILVLDAQKDMNVQEASGSVTDQAMSSFTIKTEDGTELGFLKDNCEGLESGVLGKASDDSNGSGAKVKVTYVTVSYDADSKSNFPLKVEAVK